MHSLSTAPGHLSIQRANSVLERLVEKIGSAITFFFKEMERCYPFTFSIISMCSILKHVFCSDPIGYIEVISSKTIFAFKVETALLTRDTFYICRLRTKCFSYGQLIMLWIHTLVRAVFMNISLEHPIVFQPQMLPKLCW